MIKARGSRGPKTVFDKLKDLDPEFVTEIYTLTTDALKDRVVTLTKHAVEIEEARSQDTDLQSKQEQAKEAAKTYTEPLKANKLKRRLIVQILNERGQSPSDKSA